MTCASLLIGYALKEKSFCPECFFLDKEYSLILFMTYFVESEMFNSSFCATTCSVPNFPEILIVYGFYLSFYIKLVDIKSIVRDVTRTLIGGGGGVYSYIHVLPDEFLFKSNSNFSI